MAFTDEQVEVEIEFTEEEEELPAIELANLLSQLEEMYNIFQQNRNLIADISPYDLNQETFYDEEAKDVFIGRLYRYGVLNELNYPHTVRRFPPRYTDTEYNGLKIKKIQKESPLLIGLTGSGMFIAALWMIEGIEYERETTKRRRTSRWSGEKIISLIYNVILE